MINNSIADYVAYFERIAVKHKKIRHQMPSTLPDAAKGGVHFATFTNDDVLTGLRSKIAEGVVLFLSLYDWQGVYNDAGYYRSKHDASFIVASNARSTDFEAQTAAYVLCEEIAWNIIQRLVTDSNNIDTPCNTPFKQLTLDMFKVTPVGPLWDTRYGWFVEFSYMHKRTTEMELTQVELDAIWDA